MYAAFMKYLDWILMKHDANDLAFNAKMYAYDVHFYSFFFLFFFILHTIKFQPLASSSLGLSCTRISNSSFNYQDHSFFEILLSFTRRTSFHSIFSMSGSRHFAIWFEETRLLFSNFLSFTVIMYLYMYLLSCLINQDFKRPI